MFTKLENFWRKSRFDWILKILSSTQKKGSKVIFAGFRKDLPSGEFLISKQVRNIHPTSLMDVPLL